MKTWPLLILLAEVLVFFRHILFYGHYAIPWDFRAYHLSQAWFIARSFARGELPLWDPYSYCGMPFYANLTAQLFYPPTFAVILLSNWTGGGHLLNWLELQMAAHVLAAGAFTYWLLRRIGIGRASAVIGATVYQLGAYTASQTEHLGAVDAAAWLPLAWMCVIELGGRFRRRWLAALAAGLAMSLLAGFPATTAVVFVSCFLLAGILILLRQATPLLLARTTLAAVWSILLAAIQFLPTVQLSRLSVAELRTNYLNTGGGMPLQALVSLVLPNHYGIFQFSGSTWKHPWEVTFLYTYCGIPALLFALLAIVYRRNRYTLALAALTLCAALWMLGDSTPAGKAVFLSLPNVLKNSLYAQFALCAFTLAIALLTGIGADQVLAGRARWIEIAAIVMVAADLIAVSSGRPFNTVDTRVDPGIAYDQYAGYREIPSGLRRLANESVPPARMDSIGGYPDMITHGPLFEFPSANGNDPFALVRTMQLRLLFCQGVPWGRFYEARDPDSQAFQLTSVRYLISAHDLPSPLKKIGELPGTKIYANPAVLPRFRVVNQVWRAADMRQALTLIRRPAFDAEHVAVVEASADLPQVADELGGKARVLAYTPREVRVETEAPAPALLVTSEAAYPGWRAWIDGRRQDLLLTNVAFRGLPVPAGRHIVKMRFDPPILWWSAGVTLFSLLALVLACAFGDNSKQRGNGLQGAAEILSRYR